MRQVLPFAFSVHRQEGSRHVTRVYRDEIELPIREADEREAPLALRWRGGIVTGPKPADGVPVRVYGGDGRAYEPVRCAVTVDGANRSQNVRLTRGAELDLSETFLDRDELIAELKNPKAAKARIPARPSAAIQDEQRHAREAVQAFVRDNLLILDDELWVATSLPVFIVTGRDSLGRIDPILPHRHKGSFFNIFGVLERDQALRAAEEIVAQMRAKGMTPADPIMVRIYKQESELEIWKRDRSGSYSLLKTYPICRWSGKLGPKKREGDRQAPEGFYMVNMPLMNPMSQFYLSFNLGFPNQLEEALGYEGAALMVHGACSSSGCYAMTDAGIAEIYAVAREALRGGQTAFQVQALPFRMTPENLARHRDDPNMTFWLNLKQGSDQFDVTRQPPRVAACASRYVFGAKPIDPAAPFDPLAPCPPYEVDSSVATRVAAKADRDKAAVAALSASVSVTPALAYSDGGMHEACGLKVVGMMTRRGSSLLPWMM